MGWCFTLHLLPLLDRLFLPLAANRCWILGIRSTLFTSFNLIPLPLTLHDPRHAIAERSFSGKIIYTHLSNALAKELIERCSDSYSGKLRDADEGSGTNVMCQKLWSVRVVDMKSEWIIVITKLQKDTFLSYTMLMLIKYKYIEYNYNYINIINI